MKYIDDLRNSLKELLNTDETVYLIGEDIAEPYGGAFKVTQGLSSLFPGRLITTPMSEQGFTGMAIGMALNGLKPIVEIMFNDFITLIADQLINHAAKFKEMYGKDLHLITRTPAGGYRGYGATHSQSLERIFLSIPGIDVIAPSILNHPGDLIKSAVALGKPVLFVENKLDYSRELLDEGVYKDLVKIEIIGKKSGMPLVKAFVPYKKPDVTIIVYGGMVAEIIQLQELLFMEDEISLEILAVSHISNLDFSMLSKFIYSDYLLTIEEGCKDFGWGQAVIYGILKNKRLKNYDSIGARKAYIPAAKNMEEHVLPTKEKVVEAINAVLG